MALCFHIAYGQIKVPPADKYTFWILQISVKHLPPNKKKLRPPGFNNPGHATALGIRFNPYNAELLWNLNTYVMSLQPL